MENKAVSEGAESTAQKAGTFNRALIVWAMAAFVITVASVVSYSAAQQALRQSANWPQVQLAQDGARARATGKSAESVTAGDKVDLSASLAPFIVVYDTQGSAVASSGMLNGEVPGIPKGVLDYAAKNGEDRVSWVPGKDIRIAAVVVPVRGGPGGFVLAGRSLAETERAIDNIGRLVAALWAGSLTFLLVVCLLYAFVKGNKKI